MKRLKLDGAEVVARAGEMIALSGGCEVEVVNTPPATGPYLAQSLSIDPALCLEAEPPGARLTPIAGAQRIAPPPEFLRTAFARALIACDETAGTPRPSRGTRSRRSCSRSRSSACASTPAG
ncbi:hypothetical protein [Oleiharenicola sp. Vm1]|uniref:hypothetical protein n=1 Tax=Oleiharenicola sp. Vm1 TaxID=3398393 RepID=UPI0039F4C0C0